MARFQKATKKKAKLRCALFGPSGAGKTFTALRIATGMAQATNGRIGLIDTERSTASKYSDRFSFDTLDLENKTIDDYCQAISDAQAEGITILIIDSMSHGWQELLDEVDRVAKAKYRGNTWSAWSEGTPKQRKLIDAILDYNGHIIATMRSKTEWQAEATNTGRTKPVRVGLAPEQGKGIEYEFDLLIEMSTEHVANIIKDRTGKYQDKIIDKPGEEFGKDLIMWLSEGEDTRQVHPSIQTPKQPPQHQTGELSTADKRLELMKNLAKESSSVDAFLVSKGWLKEGEGLPSLSDTQVERLHRNYDEMMKIFSDWKSKSSQHSANSGINVQ